MRNDTQDFATPPKQHHHENMADAIFQVAHELMARAFAARPAQHHDNTTNAIFEVVTPDNGTRYFSRVFQDATPTDIWKRDIIKNTTALVLGYFALRIITSLSNKVIDHVLLNNFPAISREWCIAPQGQNTTRLRRTQEKYLKMLYVGIVAMRWPGWFIHGWHLWECVRFGVAVFASCQLLLLALLVALHVLIWMAEKLARVTGWDPDKAARGVHFEGGIPGTPPQREMPRKHPSSVGMGCSLREADLVLGGQLEKDTFIAREWNVNNRKDETIVYHAITTQEKHWDFSFEELRLQDYEKTGKFLAWPVPAEREDFEEGGLSVSVQKALPSWLSTRKFRNSAFDSSYGSDDTFDKLNASLAAGAASSPIACQAQPDLLTGKGTISRSFT